MSLFSGAGITFWHATNEIILSGVLLLGEQPRNKAEGGEPSIAVSKLGFLFVGLEMSFAIVFNCLGVLRLLFLGERVLGSCC